MLTVGTKLGRYEIRTKLGEGGMGEVYLAADTRLHRKVALKVLPANLASHQERMRRFEQEATAAAALNHPNIAHIYEIGESDGVNFIAMEFIEGVTLREKIHRQQTELRKLLRYLQQVAEGLAKAHAAGIVHRDLKPDNVMITGDGYAKVLDFGLAKLTEQTKPPGVDGEAPTAVMRQPLSTPGVVMGTVGYMSPEQAQGRVDEIDHRSDIFSFGCILFEATTRHQPFEGKDVLDSLHNIVHAPTPQIKDLNPIAPVDLQRIVRRCLAKDPEDRYQTIKDVAIELRDLRREMDDAQRLETFGVPSDSSDTPISSGTKATPETQPTSSEKQPAISTGTQLSEPTSGAAARQTATGAAEVTRIKHPRRTTTLAVAAVVVAGFSIGLYAFFKWNRTTPFLKLKISRITATGKASGAAISPDGRYIVHVVDNAGLQSLEVRQVATNTNQEIIAPAEVTYIGLTFSPDSNYIYYVLRDKSNPFAALYRKPVLGGEATKLIANIASRASLSPDGKRLAFIRGGVPQDESAVILANADGTNEQQIASRKGPDYYQDVAWSPDGNEIALSTQTFKDRFHGSLVTVPVNGGEEKPFTSQTWLFIASMSWLGDGHGLIVSAAAQSFSAIQLWYISYPGGEVRQITNDLNNYDVVSLTSDSNSLVTVQRERSSNVWVVPLGAESPLSSAARSAFAVDVSRARQITSGSSEADGILGLSWTADDRLTYTSAASGNNNQIWLMQPDGSGQRQLSPSPQGSTYGEEAFPSVSPDGRYLLFTSDRVTGNPHIWRLDIDGSNLKELTTGVGEGLPAVTPDGRFVVYFNFGKGTVVSKVSIDGGESTDLTDKPSGRPTISPDGKLIACGYQADSQAGQKLAIIPIDGGSPLKLFDIPLTGPRSDRYFQWTLDGRALVYVDTHGGVSNLWIQPVDGSQAAQLTDFKSDRIYSFDFSRDGKWLALARGNSSTDVVLLGNVK